MGFRAGVLAGRGGHSSRSSGASARWGRGRHCSQHRPVRVHGRSWGATPEGGGPGCQGGRACGWARGYTDQSCARVWRGPFVAVPGALGVGQWPWEGSRNVIAEAILKGPSGALGVRRGRTDGETCGVPHARAGLPGLRGEGLGEAVLTRLGCGLGVKGSGVRCGWGGRRRLARRNQYRGSRCGQARLGRWSWGAGQAPRETCEVREGAARAERGFGRRSRAEGLKS